MRINLLLVFVFLSAFAFAQQYTITGSVVSCEDQSTLPGVSVIIKGSTTGTITDIDGNFSLNANVSDVLVFSFVGMKSQEIAVNSDDNLSVSLCSDNVGLDEVVVTALGIEKQARGLTYSTQKVDGSELNTAKDVNMINSIAGKTAGVTITRGSGGIGSSSKVVLRGSKSISGNNQVLYVIDGIPMNNAMGVQSSTLYDAYDGGDAISNLNPDDIESMQVLKGASAAALYGSQAANGVIIITTKKGSKGKTNVSFSSTTTMESVLSTPNIQNSYGKASDEAMDSWGSKTSGLSNSHVDDYFQTGFSSINSLSVSSGNENSQAYFSYANTQGKGITPGNELGKHNINLRASSQLTEKLNLDGSVNIVNQKVDGRPYNGYYFNPVVGLYLFPVGDNFSNYETYEVFDAQRNLYRQNWDYQMDQSGLSFQNPYWVQNRNANSNTRNRLISTFSANYKINDWLTFIGRLNYDNTTDAFEQQIHATTDVVISHANGEYTKFQYNSRQLYGDALLNFNKDVSDVLNINGSLGYSGTSTVNDGYRVSSYSDHLGNNYNRGLYYANFFAIQNINGEGDFPKYEYLNEIKSQAVFANVQMGYNNYLFLDVSGRNEQSSTTDDSFFYPQAGLSFIATELLGKNDILSSAKLRTSYAQVGNALAFGVANRNLVYSVLPGGSPQLPPAIANPYKNLVPERTNSFELGGEFLFLDNKLHFDATYYNATSNDQVFQILATGGEAAYYYINGGKINNKGVELSLGYKLRTGDFSWDPTFNFSKNKNEVLELDESLENPWVTLTSMEQTKIYELRVVEGGEYGDMYGYTFARDNSGNIAIDENGAPVRNEELSKIGTVNANFMLSMTNRFEYKNLSLNILFDGRFGGNVVSMTEAYLDERGLSQRTADARDAGTVVKGGTTFDPETYYKAVGGSNNISEEYVYDATNIRIRELALGYKFPSSMFNDKIKGLEIALVGRNLGFLMNKAPFDPELSLSAANGLQGLEAFSLPSTRTFGFNLKLNF